MKERQKKLSINVSGKNQNTNRSTATYNLGIPNSWMAALGLDENNRDVILYFDSENQEVIIEKNPIPKESKNIKSMKAEFERIKKAKQRMFDMETKEKAQKELFDFKMELKRRMDQEQKEFEIEQKKRIEKERAEFFEKIDKEFV